MTQPDHQSSAQPTKTGEPADQPPGWRGQEISDEDFDTFLKAKDAIPPIDPSQQQSPAWQDPND